MARIVLQHAPLNVIDVAMMEELTQSLAEIEARQDIAVIVFSGAGKCFSVGVDVAAHTPDTVEEMLAKFHTVIRALLTTKKVTVASVHGYCLGGGAELAMVCDMAYTAESAQWGFPEIKLGCYPPVACTALAALVGQKYAAELILTGRTIDGNEASAIGLANRAVNEQDLDSMVERSIDSLRKVSPAALACAKKASYAWDSMHFDKGLARAERIYFDELMKTEDAQEGIEAFMQKRQPHWKGK
ncbi:MAG TPA: enoyl-CoA hydratase/isomerase family protein [Candidatus Sulfotelmatobacter sp.]